MDDILDFGRIILVVAGALSIAILIRVVASRIGLPTAALLLAVMGIYGVTTYAVAQRTQEIGLRIALGAQMSDVLKLILRHAMTLVLIGAVIGLAGAFAVTRLMRSLLFEVVPTDLTIFLLVPSILIVVALVAGFIPARRATKIDPLVALRYE